MPHAVTTNRDESQFLKTHKNGGSGDNAMHFTPPEPDVEAYAGGEKRAIYAQCVAIAEAQPTQTRRFMEDAARA